MNPMDEVLAPYVRREINDIMDEVHPRDMNMDELCDLLKLMEAVRERMIRASGVSKGTSRLHLVRPDNHGCTLEWCEDAGADEHWTMIYTQSTHPAFRELTVGAGVSWHQGEDGSKPAVVVHIVGLGGEVDEDAHLRLSEAVELREFLDRAIRIAEEVETAEAKSP
jgi:hypothetical protein